MHRQGVWEGAEPPCPPSRCATLPAPPRFTRYSPNTGGWDVVEASLCRPAWLNPWLLVIELLNSASRPSHLLKVKGWDWKFQPFNHRLVPLSASPHPPRVTSLTQTQLWLTGACYEKQKLFHSPLSLGKFRGTWSSVPETWDQDQTHILLCTVSQRWHHFSC